jgi:RNA polymerase sigma-70 factor (ECF subfamily)
LRDEEIIELYWRRSEDAIRATAAKYGGYCGSIAVNILSDRRDAEECLNDTWTAAWTAMPPHRPQRLRLFLGKLTRTAALDCLRARMALKRGGGEVPAALEELGECVPAVPGADQAVEDRELERIMDRFLHTLPPRDCNVFLRRYWYAEPLEAIAKRYGMKVSTVKTCLYRSRGKLRYYLEGEGIFL